MQGQQSRTVNTIRNIIMGFIAKATNILLPFVIRTIIIYRLGAEYAGINSLFSSILQVLSVSELGISSAIIFSLYKPVAEGDMPVIKKWITIYKTIYKIIGTVILVLGLIICPFIKFMINGNYPETLNIYILYLIYLSNSVISYFAFGYKDVVLTVNQRKDKLSKVEFIISLTRSIAQIVVLMFIRNFYLYVIMLPVFTLLSNVFINNLANRMYPEFQADKHLSLKGLKEIANQIKGVAIGKVAVVARNSFDSIIISTLFGLTATAIYSNYYYIFSAITSLLSVILIAMSASVGNSLAVHSKEKNYNDLIKFDFYYQMIVSFCTICLFGLYQPFMQIWVGKDLMYPFHTMALFCVYFYVNNLAQIRSVYSEASGIWWEFRYFTIGEMVANLVLNIILGKFWGADGILLATIITATISSFICITYISIKKIFEKSPTQYYMNNIIYVATTVLGAIFVSVILKNIKGENIAGFVAKGFVCAVVAVIYLLLIYSRMGLFKGYLYQVVKRRKGNKNEKVY